MVVFFYWNFFKKYLDIEKIKLSCLLLVIFYDMFFILKLIVVNWWYNKFYVYNCKVRGKWLIESIKKKFFLIEIDRFYLV